MAYLSCHFFSRYLAHQTQVCAVLPEPFADPHREEYPVLYLLHGRGDDCTSYVRNSSIERYAKEHQVVVVMPSAETSFYVDGRVGKRFFSYLTKELPLVARQWLPISEAKEDTFLAGLSMGGYGALKIGLTYPERFSGIGVLSAGIRPDLMPDFMPTEEENEILHENVRLAPPEAPMAKEDIPAELLKKLVSEGKEVPAIFHMEGTEDMLYEMNQDFRKVAEKLPVPYHYEEWQGGHDLAFWEAALDRLFTDFFA